MRPCRSYLICATPRSGSTLLCEALTNTAIAGHPQEYFEALKSTGLPKRPQDYFADFTSPDIVEILGSYSRIDDRPTQFAQYDVSSYAYYLEKVFEEGTTPNGVFGAKLMWSYLDDFVAYLSDILFCKEMPVPQLLSTVFPNLHYIWVIREDKVQQAVSLWKAIQTWTWKQESSSADKQPARELHFHFAAIDHLVQQITRDEAAWQRYFATNGIQPFPVVYEELIRAYEKTALSILDYLSIPIPDNHLFAERRMKQQADALSDEWVQRYRYLKKQEQL